MTIMISLGAIARSGPCTEGFNRILYLRTGYHTENPNRYVNDIEEFPFSKCFESNDIDDLLWALRAMPEHHRLWRRFNLWMMRSISHRVDEPFLEIFGICEDFLDDKISETELIAHEDRFYKLVKKHYGPGLYGDGEYAIHRSMLALLNVYPQECSSLIYSYRQSLLKIFSDKALLAHTVRARLFELVESEEWIDTNVDVAVPERKLSINDRMNNLEQRLTFVERAIGADDGK